MHFMSQPRYNPKTQRDDWYYRIKESFRDLTSCVCSRVMLNVGFIDEPHHLLALGTEVHAHHGRELGSMRAPQRHLVDGLFSFPTTAEQSEADECEDDYFLGLAK